MLNGPQRLPKCREVVSGVRFGMACVADMILDFSSKSSWMQREIISHRLSKVWQPWWHLGLEENTVAPTRGLGRCDGVEGGVRRL